MVSVNFISQKSLEWIMPILKIFTCIWQHRIYQLSDTSLFQRLSRKFKDLCAPELGYGKIILIIIMKPILRQMLVPIQIKGTCQGKKVCTPKCPVSYVKKKYKKQTKNNKKKSASDFSTRQRSTPLLPTQLQEGFLYYTYIYVLVGEPC